MFSYQSQADAPDQPDNGVSIRSQASIPQTAQQEIEIDQFNQHIKLTIQHIQLLTSAFTVRGA